MTVPRPLPYLSTEKGLTTLYVDGKPFVALAGEIHNSSASDPSYMKENVWPHLRVLHLNTVIAPVYWELLEPAKGEFDYAHIDSLIAQAREENVRLVLLWFGLWKNGLSLYAPGWVKRDYNVYFRARDRDGRALDTISPFCAEAAEADSRAFTRLMSRLKEVDGDHRTVIMVQVENEIGLLGSDRDYSAAATAAFEESVPPEVASAFGKDGSWASAFGEDAGEWFMAYHYARAVERIASEGTRAYSLPMFVNAWLEQFPERAGVYPSGGPIAKVMRMWRLAAPTVVLYAPDIYVSDFRGVCSEYAADGNPLFIPEARRDLSSAANVFYAIGQHDALCFSPFGIEDFLDPSYSGADPSLLAMLNIEEAGFTLNGTGPYLSRSYRILDNLMPLIVGARGTGKMKGFVQQREKGCLLSYSEYDLQIVYRPQEPGKPPAGGLVVELSPGTYIVAGFGFALDVLPKKDERCQIGYVRIEEGGCENGVWRKGRVLNGDEGAYGGIKFGKDGFAEALLVEAYKFD